MHFNNGYLYIHKTTHTLYSADITVPQKVLLKILDFSLPEACSINYFMFMNMQFESVKLVMYLLISRCIAACKELLTKINREKANPLAHLFVIYLIKVKM